MHTRHVWHVIGETEHCWPPEMQTKFSVTLGKPTERAEFSYGFCRMHTAGQLGTRGLSLESLESRSLVEDVSRIEAWGLQWKDPFHTSLLAWSMSFFLSLWHSSVYVLMSYSEQDRSNIGAEWTLTWTRLTLWVEVLGIRAPTHDFGKTEVDIIPPLLSLVGKLKWERKVKRKTYVTVVHELTVFLGGKGPHNSATTNTEPEISRMPQSPLAGLRRELHSTQMMPWSAGCPAHLGLQDNCCPGLPPLMMPDTKEALAFLNCLHTDSQKAVRSLLEVCVCVF